MRVLTPLELAFLGDAIHTAFVRKWALENLDEPMHKLHSFCAKRCSAVWQAGVLSQLELSDEEKEIARRARNAKPKHQAKNADGADYKKATAFEAIVGFLFVSKNTARLQEVLQKSLKIEENDAI